MYNLQVKIWLLLLWLDKTTRKEKQVIFDSGDKWMQKERIDVEYVDIMVILNWITM